jgi:succinate dehydrogenase/fumarate reductase flavoprotein subunit
MLALLEGDPSGREACNARELMQNMQRVMWNDVGPFRTKEKTPLSNKPLVRDLITEIAPPSERSSG